MSIKRNKFTDSTIWKLRSPVLGSTDDVRKHMPNDDDDNNINNIERGIWVEI